MLQGTDLAMSFLFHEPWTAVFVGLWLGWNCKWQSILLCLPGAAALYGGSLWLAHWNSIFWSATGMWVCGIIPMALLGAFLGKLISQSRAKKKTHSR